MRICICHAPRRLEVRDRHDTAPSSATETTVVLRNAGDAHALLRGHCAQSFGIFQLRRLLAESVHLVHHLSDNDVLHQTASRLANGQLRLISIEPKQKLGASGRSANPLSESVALSAATHSPSLIPASTQPPFLRRHIAVEPPAPPPELHDDVDQDLQAATLEQAARDGTPFCAVCNSAKRPQTTAEQRAA